MNKNKIDKIDKNQIVSELENEEHFIELNSFKLDFNCSFDQVSIYIASPSDIYSISKGEVSNTDTLNYRTLKPEKNGIFCSTIFGPTESFKCLCERYVGEAYQGLRCERCNVVVGDRRLRRVYFGHITLNTMVVHPWFYNQVSIVLKMTKKIFYSILNFDMFIFIKDTADDQYKKYNMMTASDYYSSGFLYEELVSGGDAIYQLLSEVDLDFELDEINKFLSGKQLSEASDKIIKRKDILQSIKNSNRSITNVIVSVLPVTPADTRPIVHLDGGGIATVEINEMYRKTINRNNRLEKLKDMKTHRIILNNEKYMINQAIISFMGPQSNKNGKSIAEYIKGKKGYFRRALLGKRTDYSGRASIVVGEDLNLDECSIPNYIALELFKPFLYSKILRDKKAHSIIEAKRIVEAETDYVYKILDNIVQDVPIILNRAPTLHRLSLQAFKIKLNRSHSIKIPPLVCTGYAADFDGDQMACHLPLTISSRIEAFSLMLSRNNLFLPSNGRLIVTPTKDIVMGLYYLSLMSEDSFQCKNNKRSLNIPEVRLLYEYNKINMNTKINIIIKDINGYSKFLTNYGILQVWQFVIHDSHKLDFKQFNQIYDKDHIHNLIMYVFYQLGWNSTLDFLNKITKLGFKILTDAGISYSMLDIVKLDMEDKIQKIDDKIEQMQQFLEKGFMAEDEYDSQYMQTWHTFIESNSVNVLDTYQNHDFNANDLNNVKGNNIYLIYKSGARGSASQMQQVSGLRGFMSKISGQVSRFIIKSNLLNGLNVFEYFESTNGERKGLSDTAIKTSKAGHFTRRLVDISHSIYIAKKDCNTNNYLHFNKSQDRRTYNINFQDAIMGKVLAKSITLKNGILLAKDSLISNKVFNLIQDNDVQDVYVYSPLYCNEAFGICAKCYGIDFSTYKLVDIGCPVGMIAAQSVGEPGTQLTMRTTHTGGVASTSSSQEEIYANQSGIVDLSNISSSVNKHNEHVVLTSGSIVILNNKKEIVDKIIVHHGFILNCKHNDHIKQNEVIAFINKAVHKIISMYDGIVRFSNIIPNITVQETYDQSVGVYRRKVISSIQYSDNAIHPAIIIYNEKTKSEFYYYLDEGYLVNIQENDKIVIGDVIASKYLKNVGSQDITGGLPKVIDVFEAKTYLQSAILATYNGIVKIVRHKKNKIIYIHDKENNDILSKVIVNNNRNIVFQDNMQVSKGTILVDGKINLQDLLDIMGYNYTIKYIMGSISTIYEDQGVNINYKHIETIVKQMLKYGVVTMSTNSNISLGKVLEYCQLVELSKSMKGFTYKRIISGITKVSLLYYPSFISSSSFQHTIPTIAAAALNCSVDKLQGIKENVIFNKCIPVGTGFKDFIIQD